MDNMLTFSVFFINSRVSRPQLLIVTNNLLIIIDRDIQCSYRDLSKNIGNIIKQSYLDLQVNGEVYAVDQHTLLIRNFVYDGNGKDTFFWAGTSNR